MPNLARDEALAVDHREFPQQNAFLSRDQRLGL
jgi:hypothetical protein